MWREEHEVGIYIFIYIFIFLSGLRQVQSKLPWWRWYKMNEGSHINTISVCASLGPMFHHIALLSVVFYLIPLKWVCAYHVSLVGDRMLFVPAGFLCACLCWVEAAKRTVCQVHDGGAWRAAIGLQWQLSLLSKQKRIALGREMAIEGD